MRDFDGVPDDELRRLIERGRDAEHEQWIRNDLATMRADPAFAERTRAAYARAKADGSITVGRSARFLALERFDG